MAHLTLGGIVARSALSKYATRLYPFEKRPAYAATRGHIVNDINACIFCSLCQKKCPTHAITVTKAEKLWTIDRMKCIQCGACVDACNLSAIGVVPRSKGVREFVKPMG